jgi:hypothetical protein
MFASLFVKERSVFSFLEVKVLLIVIEELSVDVHASQIGFVMI